MISAARIPVRRRTWTQVGDSVEGPRRWRRCTDRIQVKEEGPGRPQIFSATAGGANRIFSGVAGGGSQNSVEMQVVQISVERQVVQISVEMQVAQISLERQVVQISVELQVQLRVTVAAAA